MHVDGGLPGHHLGDGGAALLPSLLHGSHHARQVGKKERVVWERELFSILLRIYPEVSLLGQTIILNLIF